MTQFNVGDTVRRTNPGNSYKVGAQPFTVIALTEQRLGTIGGWVIDSFGQSHNPVNLVANPIISTAEIFPKDVVNHPSHYKSNGIEVIDIIEAFDLGPHLANSTKYILRAGKKSVDTEIQDLEKAQWYLDRRIANLKATKESNPVYPF